MDALFRDLPDDTRLVPCTTDPDVGFLYRGDHRVGTFRGLRQSRGVAWETGPTRDRVLGTAGSLSEAVERVLVEDAFRKGRLTAKDYAAHAARLRAAYP